MGVASNTERLCIIPIHKASALTFGVGVCVLCTHVQAFSPSVGAFARPGLAPSTKSLASMPLVAARKPHTVRVRNGATAAKMEFLAPAQIYEAVSNAGIVPFVEMISLAFSLPPFSL